MTVSFLLKCSDTTFLGQFWSGESFCGQILWAISRIQKLNYLTTLKLSEPGVQWNLDFL